MKQESRNQCATLYKECNTEEERIDTVTALSEAYELNEMEIRQVLQTEGVYIMKEGKTSKEQYAHALWSITNIPAKEWMKLTAKSQKTLMDIFKKGNVK